MDTKSIIGKQHATPGLPDVKLTIFAELPSAEWVGSPINRIDPHHLFHLFTAALIKGRDRGGI